MDPVITFSVITLGCIAAVFATILFYIAKKFSVKEDPRIDAVEDLLPAANCGGCGYPGCRGMAEALVKASDEGGIDDLLCPPGGNETMSAIAKYLGMEVAEKGPTLAVLRCGGDCINAPAKTKYEGPVSCIITHSLYAGESGCPTGCLGNGDCVTSCTFDAIHMSEETKLPVVDEGKCTSCGACVKACPRDLIQIRPTGKKSRRVWINCRNTEKGAAARKNCKTACIGCGKCVKICTDIRQAITMENNLAYIDFDKCITCGKCVNECPTGAIAATFTPPPKKQKAAASAKTELD
jgi:Na+-translocating ferredoxin:NAD+ oxidoreductase subunit B